MDVQLWCPKLIETVRKMERRSDMPYYLIGHSAGGQFVERLLVFADVKPLRAVAANAGQSPVSHPRHGLSLTASAACPRVWPARRF